MKTRKFLMVVVLICLFMVGLPVVVRYENMRLMQQYNLNETDVTEFIDDTGVVYLKYKASITPKLDSKGNVIIRKGVK